MKQNWPFYGIFTLGEYGNTSASCIQFENKWNVTFSSFLATSCGNIELSTKPYTQRNIKNEMKKQKEEESAMTRACVQVLRGKKRVGGLSVAVFCYLRSCQTTFMNCLHFYIALEMFVCACVCVYMYNMREAKVKHIDLPKQRQQLQKNCINSLSYKTNCCDRLATFSLW